MLLLSFILISSNHQAFAQNADSSKIKAPHVEVELLSSHEVLPRSGKTWFGVAFKLEPEWHIYWKNPGDSGAAPKFEFQNDKIKSDPPLWPLPKRIPFGDLTNIGYENEVVFPLEGEVTDSTATEARFQVKLEWLVCKEECIPGFATLHLRRPVGEARTNPNAMSQIERTLQAVPAEVLASNFPLGQNLRITSAENSKVSLQWETEDAEVSGWTLYPVDGERFSPAPPEMTFSDGTLEAHFRVLPGSLGSQETAFVFSRTAGERQEAYEVLITTDSLSSTKSLWFLLLSALLGGMILNLMPCVFPVLSIKVFSFMKAHQGDRRALMKDGLWYTLGTVITFGLLGLSLLFLKQGGEAVGWGFQLQSPIVIYALALLFFLLAFNFLGLFEMGTSAMNWAGLRMNKKEWSSAFGTGILSVMVAAPCTGPFMGAALGATSVLPALPAMLIFLTLGFGLALPLLLLCVFPAWLSKLPRPGAWMETLKEFFAFPLLATVLWLLWVLTQQTGANGLLWAGLSFLGVAFAIWLNRRGFPRGALMVFVLSLLGPGWSLATMPQDSFATDGGATTSSAWASFDEGRIAEAQSSGRAVFIDFTAAWCITCQWNKKSVLDTAAIQDLFRAQNVFLIRADWTRYDERITQALAKFGRASVPVYAYYPPGQTEAQILPQILTATMIEQLFNKEEE